MVDWDELQLVGDEISSRIMAATAPADPATHTAKWAPSKQPHQCYLCAAPDPADGTLSWVKLNAPGIVEMACCSACASDLSRSITAGTR